jgi:hypothetical protein
VGNKWEYDAVKLLRAEITFKGKSLASIREPSSGTSVYQVVGADKSTPPVYEYTESTDWNSSGGTDSEKIQINVVNDSAGLKILSTVQDSQEGKAPEKQTYDPALLYYAKDPSPGRSWDVGTMKDGDTKSPTTAKAVGRETDTVPAGTFKDCLKVVYISDDISGTMEMWDKTFTITSGRSRGVYWIADGVGVVKELEVATSKAETPGPDGTPVTVEAATCSVSELKPGYVAK